MSRYGKSDYINREMAADSIVIECDGVTLEQARQALKDCPRADVEPVRHGRWIRERVGSDNSSVGYFKISMAECSECGTCVMGKPNYCPNCGARMDGDDNE